MAAHHGSRTRFMHGGPENEGAGLRVAWLRPTHACHAPASECTCEFSHVALGVAGAHAERVQLHDLARKILVETALVRRIALVCAQRGAAVGTHRALLIEK